MDEETPIEIKVTEEGPVCPICKLARSNNGKILLVFLFVVIPTLLILSILL